MAIRIPPSETAEGRCVLKTMSAIVLAGGASRRFGSDKTRAAWGAKTLLERAVEPLAGSFGEVLVVTRKPEGLGALRRKGVRVVADLFSEPHPMGGLLSGLDACVWEYAFVCGADMPFVSPALARALGEAASGYGAAVPRWEGALQPLCAVYSRRVRGVLRRMVGEGQLALGGLLDIVPTRYLSEDEVAAADPAGRSFVDIDTRADYARWGEARRGA